MHANNLEYIIENKHEYITKHDKKGISKNKKTLAKTILEQNKKHLQGICFI